MSSSETTPVVPGFYPDPSVCRVGEDYYLAHSSFEYAPGVPIWHSRDLLTWEQIGHALDRPSHIPERAGRPSGGIFAPTLRHHDGRFWMITTDYHRIYDGQLIVSAEHPAGPWTDPVFTAGALGIDPDLAWDEDGTCHMTWAGFGGMQTGRVAHDAVDIGDRSARRAHHVVVVVAGAPLVPCGGARGLDPPQQPGRRQVAQHVVDVLDGGARQFRQHGPEHGLGVRMRQAGQCVEHRHPPSGHLETGPSQRLLEVCRIHPSTLVTCFE